MKDKRKKAKDKRIMEKESIEPPLIPVRRSFGEGGTHHSSLISDFSLLTSQALLLYQGVEGVSSKKRRMWDEG
jgi:hypothetical protein